MFFSFKMGKKHLLACCLCTLSFIFVANVFLGLLPVYAVKLGADPAQAGIYLSLCSLVFGIGNFVAGWVSDRFHRRKTPLLLAVALSVVPVWWMGQVSTVTELTIVTAIAWFFVGIAFPIINILAGLAADEQERGKLFGILGVFGGIGGLLAGIFVGPMIDRWGYKAMFAAMVLALILYFLSGLFLDEQVTKGKSGQTAKPLTEQLRLGRGFYLLFIANLFVWLMSIIAGFGKPLIMNDLKFDAAAISSTIAIASAVNLPLPLIVGWLSDSLGRIRLIALCYLAGMVGTLILIPSVVLWHFWVSTVLVVVAGGAGGVVATALVTDIVPPESLGTGLALFNITISIAGVIGFAAAGGVVQVLGMATSLVFGAALPIVAVFLLRGVRSAKPKPLPALV